MLKRKKLPSIVYILPRGAYLPVGQEYQDETAPVVRCVYTSNAGFSTSWEHSRQAISNTLLWRDDLRVCYKYQDKWFYVLRCAFDDDEKWIFTQHDLKHMFRLLNPVDFEIMLVKAQQRSNFDDKLTVVPLLPFRDQRDLTTLIDFGTKMLLTEPYAASFEKLSVDFLVKCSNKYCKDWSTDTWEQFWILVCS
jgi:hypothetical protein